jgi:nucleotide-binding universal stress UspA family protein
LKCPPASILCATDLSPLGNAAAAVAYGLARRGSVVHLFHVAEPVLFLRPVASGSPYRAAEEDLEATERRADSRLRALVPASAAEEGVRTETHVVHESDVPAKVLAEAKRVGAQLIVIGTHGRTGIGRILMGSVASQVVKSSDLPVVMVNERGLG